MSYDQNTDECSIERCRAEDNFSIIPNEISQHPTMSPIATIVLLYLLSCKADWVIKPKNVWKAKNISRDKVYAAFDELIDLGYMQRITVKLGNLKSSVKYKVSYLNKFLRRPESQDTESRDTGIQDALIRTINKKNDSEKEFVAPEARSENSEHPEVPEKPTLKSSGTITIQTPKGPLSLSEDNFYLKAIRMKDEHSTDELKYAWNTLAQYSGIVHDWWKFIDGVILKYRQGITSDRIAKKTVRKTPVEKSVEKSVTKTDAPQEERKSVMDFLNERIDKIRIESEDSSKLQRVGSTG